MFSVVLGLMDYLFLLLERGGVFLMAIIVKRQADDTDDKLISNFKKAIIQYNFLELIKEKMTYLKPAARRNQNRSTRRSNKRRK